jgi:hypothetical protein
MFSSRTPADTLAAALEAYQTDFEKKLKSQPNPDAEEARQRITRAEDLARRSGLGKALEVLLEHTRNWPSWSRRDDFRKWVGFPLGEVLAKEQREEGKFKSTNTTIVCFTYHGGQYAMIFKDNGGCSLPDGELFYSGTVEFVANSETVLGLNISRHPDEFTSGDWHYHSIYALKMGPWSKSLLEIAAHIRAYDRNSNMRREEDRVMEQAKKISI